jgi:hypothetical protein
MSYYWQSFKSLLYSYSPSNSYTPPTTTIQPLKLRLIGDESCRFPFPIQVKIRIKTITGKFFYETFLTSAFENLNKKFPIDVSFPLHEQNYKTMDHITSLSIDISTLEKDSTSLYTSLPGFTRVSPEDSTINIKMLSVQDPKFITGSINAIGPLTLQLYYRDLNISEITVEGMVNGEGEGEDDENVSFMFMYDVDLNNSPPQHTSQSSTFNHHIFKITPAATILSMTSQLNDGNSSNSNNNNDGNNVKPTIPPDIPLKKERDKTTIPFSMSISHAHHLDRNRKKYKLRVCPKGENVKECKEFKEFKEFLVYLDRENKITL